MARPCAVPGPPTATAPHLLACLDHGTGVVLAQAAVDGKTNEITVFATLLAQAGDLDGVLVTADALHAQRDHATWLHDHGAHYLVTVAFPTPPRPSRSPARPGGRAPGNGRPRRYGLAWFRISFGMLQVKAYTKGEHVLRFEATVHNTKELRCRRSLENFAEIITRLAGMADRFATALDCADIGFLPDGVLDELPLPAQTGPRRTAGVDLN